MDLGIPGIGDAELAIVTLVANDPPPNLRSAGFSEEISALVERLLHKDPDQRPDAEQLVSLLAHIESAESSDDAEPAEGPPSIEPGENAATTSSDLHWAKPGSTPRSHRPKRALVSVSALALLLLIAGALFDLPLVGDDDESANGQLGSEHNQGDGAEQLDRSIERQVILSREVPTRAFEP